VTEITDDRQKLDWLTSYADADIADLWSSFPEYEVGSWTLFLERLKIEYPELMSEEQGTMEQLRKLCREYQDISMLEEEWLMSFKRRFMFMAQKCLKPPAVTGNRELVELFVKSLDTTFQDALNSRLSLQGTLKVDGQGRSRVEDPYALEHVVQKAVDLVSGKTIARALKHTPVILSRNRKVDAESRGPVTFSKEEMVRKVEQGPDVESLQQEINVLKTMYEQQERGREKHEKSVQGAIDSIRTLLQNQGPMARETVAPPMRYGPSQPPMLPRPPKKCFYCFELDHLFLFCPAKTEDERKGLILVDKFTVRFANGEPIPIEHNMSIKDCVQKYLPSSIAVMMWGDPELETCSVWDQEPDTGGIVVTPQPVRKQMEIPSRSSGQSDDLLHLRNKISNLEVMIQKMNLEKEPMLEPEEEEMEDFLKRMVAEYVQTRKEPAPKKKSGFQMYQ